MDLVLDKIISNPAFVIAISPDCTKIAVSGERTITIFSFPDLQQIEKLKVAHTCSMVFLSDSRSLLIQNTTGKTFVWNGISLESTGKWPVPKWQEKPMFYCGDDHVLWAGHGGIWMYDARERKISNIFSSPRDLWICRCEEDVIKCIAMDYGEGENTVDILSLTYEGSIQKQAQSDIQVKNGVFKSPAWSNDDLIAISTSVRPNFPLNIVYLLNTEGQVLGQEWVPAGEDNGSFYYGNNMFIKISMVGAYNINIYNANNIELIYKLDCQKLASYGMTTPPTFAWITPDNRILVGSWNKLFVFKFES